MKLKILAAMVVIAGIGVFFYVAIQTWKMGRIVVREIELPIQIEKNITNKIVVETTTTQVATSSASLVLSTTTLTRAEEKVLIEKFSEQVSIENPRVALNALRDLMAKNPAVLRSCHGLVHAIGHAAYEKYNDFGQAMKFQDDLCGSGYIHGIIETKFAHVTDVVETIQHVCDDFSKLTIDSCYHGVGHGLMYVTDNNVPKSLSYCEMYPDQTARIRCSEGIYMENFSTDLQDHTSNYLHASDPSYPCGEQPKLYQPVCYFYAPLYYLTLHPDHYTEGLKWCATLGKQAGYSCARGMGSRAMRYNLNDPNFVEQVCRAEPTLTPACLDGMVSYYLVNFSSRKTARNMCENIDERSRKDCAAAIDRRAGLFEE